MTDLESRVRDELAQLDRAGLRRELREPSGIDLSSNDYLGLAASPQLRQRMAAALQREGCGSTGSRLLRGHRDSFACIERRFAEFKRTDRSLYFSSGYLANLAVLTTFAQGGDVIFSDQFNHASLIDGSRLSRARRVIFPHNDVAALRRLMNAEKGHSPWRGHAAPYQNFLVVESLFSMEGDFAPLADYIDLCRETGAALIVDEAHAVGIYGDRGSGLIEAAGIDDAVFLSINTCGKALGAAGAFVAGPAWAIEFLQQRARPFIFSTAPPPAIAAAIDAALTLIDAEPERRARVLQLASYLRQCLDLPSGSHIVPVIFGSNERLGSNERALAVAAALQAEGFDVRAIRPPTVPEGTARLRLSVNVNVTEAQLDRLVDLLCAASS